MKTRRILLDICAYYIIVVITELSSLHCVFLLRNSVLSRRGIDTAE